MLTKELFFSQNTPPPFLPCQPTVPMPGFEGQMRNQRAAPPPLSNWFKQALGGAGLVVCGVWPTEHAQWGGMPCDGNTVGSPICWESVCTSRPGPFSIQSSEQPDQFTVEWTHTHTSFIYNNSSTALHCTAASRQARIGISSCMQKKKEQWIKWLIYDWGKLPLCSNWSSQCLTVQRWLMYTVLDILSAPPPPYKFLWQYADSADPQMDLRRLHLSAGWMWASASEWHFRSWNVWYMGFVLLKC